MIPLWPFIPLLAAMLFAGCTKKSAPPEAEAIAPVADMFEDITARSGVQFVHRAGTNYFMPDQVGSGIAIIDFDRGGRLDLYFVQNGGTGTTARNVLLH